jgi:hypothetical protein
MKATRLFVLVLVLSLLATLAGAVGAQEPQLTAVDVCPPGTGYVAGCDVAAPFGEINVLDIQRLASKYKTTGPYTEAYWNIAGNAGTVPGTNFLGTPDNQPLVIKTSGAEAMRIDPAGHVGIGTAAPQERLTLSPGSSFAIEMVTPIGVAEPVSGGSLSAGTYYFKLVAEDAAGGTTAGSAEVICTVDGFTSNRCTLSWFPIPGAQKYRIYKGASPDGQDRYHTATTNAFNYDTDVGATSGNVPAVTTAYVTRAGQDGVWANAVRYDGVSVFAAGNVGIGTATPRAQLHVRQSSLNMNPEALELEDLIAEDTDAVLGLYSSSGGLWGSAIALGEIGSDGALVNKWGIARRTSGGGSDLRFTYGTDPDYGLNPTRLAINPDGGLRVPAAASTGVLIGELLSSDGIIGGDGLVVANAGDDGVQVVLAGSPSTTNFSTAKDGFEVDGAEGNGLFVGRADLSGVEVRSARNFGVYVASASGAGVYVASANFAGVEVGSTSFGVYVLSADADGVFVNSAGDDGFDCNAAGDTCFEGSGALNYAAFFDGHLAVTGSCAGCVLSAFGRNAGPTALEPGEVVAVRGVNPTAMQNAPAVMEVSPATGSDAVIGVVAGWAEVVKEEAEDSAAPERAAAGLEAEGALRRAQDGAREATATLRLVPREGPAPPGEYVNIIVYGLAQVKASALAGTIQPGTRLTAAEMAGHARAVKTVEVQGVQVAENTPVLGIALESWEAGEGLIWVLVNPR